jgi:hypothetical protein
VSGKCGLGLVLLTGLVGIFSFFSFWVWIIEGQCWEAGGFRMGTRSAQRDKE